VRTRVWPVILAAAAAVAWVQLAGVHWAARTWTVVLLVVVPALMVAQGRALRDVATIPRTQAYVSSILSLWLLVAATIGVSFASGYAAADLGLVHVGALRTIAIATLLTVAGITTLFLFRLAGMTEAPIMRELIPVTAQERVLFVGVSLTAGICEEIIFRGFLIHVLHGATGSLLIALLLSSGAFGVSHAYQQPAGALRATLLGLLLALPLVIDGSVVPAMVGHAVIDVIGGLWLAKRLL